MRKEKLMLLPLCAGLTLLFVSWYQSYPLSVDSPFDYPINHISSLYWVGLPVLLGTLYIMANKLKNNTLKCIAVLGVVMSMYSLSYFYYLLPGSDSHYARGLTEYYITTGDLNPSEPSHSYFQWSSFFVLCNMATNLLGLELKYFEFILYATIGFLYTTSLYGYFSKVYRDGSHVAVVAFFIIVTYQFNYQFAPFSLCIGLLFLLFMIESHGTTSRNAMIAKLVIFASMSFMHPFVALFFVLYTLLKYVLSREKRYMTLFVLTLIVYLAVLLFNTSYFPKVVKRLVMREAPYSELLKKLTVEPAAPLDTIAQMFARSVLILTAVISGLGFMIMLLGRKFRHVDHAILLSGITYAVAGALIPILGFRAFPLIAIPVSFGATYFLKPKFTKYYKFLLLVLIILFTFVIVHDSYSWKWFQTRDDYRSANFFVKFYRLSERERILSHVTVGDYIEARIDTTYLSVFDNGYRSPPQDLETYDCIVYTAGLERSLLMWNHSVDTEIHKIEEKFNVVFDSGFSFIAAHMNSSSH